MSLPSRLIEVAKGIDALIGRPLARATQAPRRTLPNDPEDVLIIRLWGLGNLALLAPQFAANRQRRLRLMTLQRNVSFVRRYLPEVQLLAVPEPLSPRLPRAVVQIARQLSRDRPQVIVDCEQFLRLPLTLARWASGAPCVGLDTPGQCRGPLLDEPVTYEPLRHSAETFAALWARAGLATHDGPGGLQSTPELHQAQRRSWGLDHRPLVIMHPGSGDHFPGRRWPAEHFGELMTLLAKPGTHQLVITGTADERRLCAQAVKAARGTGSSAITDLSGQLDIQALIDLLSGAALLVSNDTGPLHLADALDTPTVGLFGPNTPHRYGPRRPGSVALHSDLPCSPCLDDRYMKHSSCRHYACMTSLAVEDVAGPCRAILGASAPQPAADAHAHSS